MKRGGELVSLASLARELEDLLREDRRSRDPTPILPHKFGRHLGTFSSHTKIG